MALPGTNSVIRLFDRDTKRLATQVMGAMVFAALVFALLVQERYPKAADLTEEARQPRGNLLLNSNPAALFEVVGSNEKSTDEITSGQGTSVDHWVHCDFAAGKSFPADGNRSVDPNSC